MEYASVKPTFTKTTTSTTTLTSTTTKTVTASSLSSTRPFLNPSGLFTLLTTIGILGRNPSDHASSLYSLAPLDKRLRLSSSSSLHNSSSSVSMKPSSVYFGPMTDTLQQATRILTDIAVALYHRLNWNSVPLTIPNSFRTVSNDLLHSMQQQYDNSIASLLPSLSNFSSDTLMTASTITLQRMKQRFTHLAIDFDQRLHDIVSQPTSSTSTVQKTSPSCLIVSTTFASTVVSSSFLTRPPLVLDTDKRPSPPSDTSSVASSSTYTSLYPSTVTARIINKHACNPGHDINLCTKTLIIGDSNLRHLTLRSELTQILCIPGAKLIHIIDFFSHSIISQLTDLTHIYILIGLNDRDNDFRLTHDRLEHLKDILDRTGIRFTLFLIPRPPCLSFYQSRNIELCNAFIRDRFISFMPTDFMTFRRDDIHFAHDSMKTLADKILQDLRRF